MNRLTNKGILITGANFGIGKTSARLFAQQKSNLTITGRLNDRLKNLKHELEQQNSIKVFISCFDIQNRNGIQSFVNSIKGPIDDLLYDAGLASGKGSICSSDFVDWNKIIDTGEFCVARPCRNRIQ